jgi:hypothetical protein
MSPYDKRSKELLAYADGLKALAVPDKLTVAEASSLFEIWKDDMAINSSECWGGFFSPDARRLTVLLALL